jgi:hypothetical protein
MANLLPVLAGAFVLAVSSAQAMEPAPPSSDDTCLILAEAKHEQWLQRRVLIDQTKTFADGSTKTISILVTENTAYLKRVSWRSRAVSVQERGVPTAQQVLTGMGLGQCTKGATVQEANQPTTIYTYDYLPDDKGFIAHGKMWISESTGLPVKEEMQDPAPPANAMVANAIAATYTYNDDVQVPAGAELANSTRLFGAAQLLGHLQSGSGTGLGGGSH